MKRLVLFPMILIMACATSTGVQFSMHQPPGDNESIIYFFVSKKDYGTTACLIVTIDSIERGCVGNPGFLRVKLKPGQHSFSFRPKALIDVGVEIRKFSSELDGGRVYYLESKRIRSDEDKENALEETYVHALGGFTIGWVLTEEEEALEKLKELREWE